MAEVRLADSTPRLGEPATWGSGQRKVNCSTETWAPFNGWVRPSMQREDQQAMATGLAQIAATLCCEPPFEERSAVALHAAFCGSRGRVTASGDPVESLVSPSVHRNATGMLPSAAIVRMNRSCLRSGRWSLLKP